MTSRSKSSMFTGCSHTSDDYLNSEMTSIGYKGHQPLHFILYNIGDNYIMQKSFLIHIKKWSFPTAYYGSNILTIKNNSFR